MNELTLTNLPGHLRIMDDLGIKPNYSQLARLYGIDRHTVAKIHKSKGTCPRKGRPKDSEWDKYEEEIASIGITERQFRFSGTPVRLDGTIGLL